MTQFKAIIGFTVLSLWATPVLMAPIEPPGVVAAALSDRVNAAALVHERGIECPCPVGEEPCPTRRICHLPERPIKE
jgi:hypothetical protein